MKIDRITVNPKVCQGKPTIRGMRLTVEFILKLIASGYTIEKILEDYPELEREDINQCAGYAAWLASEQTIFFD